MKPGIAAGGPPLPLPLLVLLLPLLLASTLAGCAGAPPAPAAPPARVAVQLTGMRELAADLRVGGSVVGGISGIDYDAATGLWLLASDDRAEHGPARFYRARIAIDGDGAPGEVHVAGMTAWTQPDGSAYAARGRPGLVADVEALRIDPLERSLWHASEGDRAAAVPSFVRRTGMDGRYLEELPLPAALRIRPDCACGARSNGGPEGLSFTPDGKLLWIAMEAPLLEDGAGLSRISLVDRHGGLVAQYAYRLDEAPAPALAGGASDNGIAEILALERDRLLVLERSGNEVGRGQFRFGVRLYDVNLAGAVPVDPDAPIDSSTARPPAKRLVFDSAALPAGWADNYEAMAWGPALGAGRRSLVLASDNNFSGAPTRFLTFSLTHERP